MSNSSALHTAVQDLDIPEIRQLLAEGADVDARNDDNRTPLMVLASASAFCDHDDHDDDDVTPEVAEILLSHGADTSLVDDVNNTAAMTAAMCGNAGVLEVLCGHGSGLEARSSSGFTALTLAVMARQPECVGLLLAHGASLCATDWSGRTVIERAAAKSGCQEIVGLLVAERMRRCRPLSLVEYCRNSIISTLPKHKLWEKIQSLPIPTPLKQYLLLKRLF